MRLGAALRSLLAPARRRLQVATCALDREGLEIKAPQPTLTGIHCLHVKAHRGLFTAGQAVLSGFLETIQFVLVDARRRGC